MSNSTKAGRIDRRIPVKGCNIFVADEIDKVYSGSIVFDRQKLEVESYRSAYDKLDGDDLKAINGFVRKFDRSKHSNNENRMTIKGFGETGVLETVAKLGIFLNAVGRKS